MFLVGESLDQTVIQRELLDSSNENIKCKVIYIPNINIESSQLDFINSLSPKILITRDGDEISELLNQNTAGLNQKTLILSKENMGAITVTSDGKELKVRSFVDEKELVLH